MGRFSKYMDNHPWRIFGTLLAVVVIAGAAVVLITSGGSSSTSEGKGYKNIEELELVETNAYGIELELEEALQGKYDHDYGQGARTLCTEHKVENEYSCQVIAPYFGHNYYLYFISVDPSTGKAKILQTKNPYLTYSPYEDEEYLEYNE